MSWVIQIASLVGLALSVLLALRLFFPRRAALRESNKTAWQVDQNMQHRMEVDRENRIWHYRNHPEKFTAAAMCPACEKIDVHPFRLPKPDVVRTIRTADGDDECELRVWGSGPYVESRYEVIRRCSCGHEWGQT